MMRPGIVLAAATVLLWPATAGAIDVGAGGVGAGGGLSGGGVSAGVSAGGVSAGVSASGGGVSANGAGAGVSAGTGGVTAGVSAGGGAVSAGATAGGVSAGVSVGGADASAGVSAGNAGTNGATEAATGNATAAAPQATGSAQSTIVLPRYLRPTNGGEAALLTRDEASSAPVKQIAGTPRRVLGACKKSVAQAAMPYGSTQVIVRSYGKMKQLEDGGYLAPLFTRVTYKRRGGYEVRQAPIWCQIDASGVVSSLLDTA